MIAKEVKKPERIDTERAKQAVRLIEIIRRSKQFDKGKLSMEINREWRERKR